MKLPETIDKVQRDYELRKLACKTIPLKRRGRREKLRPNTALIAEAAQAKILRRVGGEPAMHDVVDETATPLKRGA